MGDVEGKKKKKERKEKRVGGLCGPRACRNNRIEYTGVIGISDSVSMRTTRIELPNHPGPVRPRKSWTSQESNPEPPFLRNP